MLWTRQVKIHKAGGWVERKHGKKKRYVKIFFAVDVETKQALTMLVTTDGTHDSRVFPKLMRKVERHGKIINIYGDGAFDSSKEYEMLESKGIEAVIKPRRNSRLDTPSQTRRRAVTLYRHLSHKRWAKLKDHGKRWSLETAYSTFKRMFEEFGMAKNHEKHHGRNHSESVHLQHAYKPINREHRKQRKRHSNKNLMS